MKKTRLSELKNLFFIFIKRFQWILIALLIVIRTGVIFFRYRQGIGHCDSFTDIIAVFFSSNDSGLISTMLYYTSICIEMIPILLVLSSSMNEEYYVTRLSYRSFFAIGKLLCVAFVTLAILLMEWFLVLLVTLSFVPEAELTVGQAGLDFLQLYLSRLTLMLTILLGLSCLNVKVIFPTITTLVFLDALYVPRAICFCNIRTMNFGKAPPNWMGFTMLILVCSIVFFFIVQHYRDILPKGDIDKNE